MSAKSSKIRQKEYRARKIKEMGLEEYRKMNRDKARARRAKLKMTVAKSQESKDDPLIEEVVNLIKKLKIDVTSKPEFKEKMVKEAVAKAKIAITNFKLDESCEDVQQEFLKKSNGSGKPIKPRTIKSYFSKMKTLYNRYTGNVWDCRSFDWLKDTDGVLDFIAKYKRWKPVSKWQYVNAVASILSRVDGYEDVHAIYSKANKSGLAKYLEERKENILSPEQRENILPWSKIKKLKPLPNLADQAIFALMRGAPRRLSYRTLTWKTEDDGIGNYILINNDKVEKLVLNNYKTDKTYGRFEIGRNYISDKNGKIENSKKKYGIGITKKLSDLLLNYIKEFRIPKGEFLFVKDNENVAMSQGEFSDWISEVMTLMSGGKRITATLMRIAYATHVMKTRKSVNFVEAHSKLLGHSVEQLNQYAKLDLL